MLVSLADGWCRGPGMYSRGAAGHHKVELGMQPVAHGEIECVVGHAIGETFDRTPWLLIPCVPV